MNCREILLRAAALEPRIGLSPMRAVQITELGGHEVMNVVELPDPTPGDGEQLFEVSTAGVNFADTHHRRGAQQTL